MKCDVCEGRMKITEVAVYSRWEQLTSVWYWCRFCGSEKEVVVR